MYDNALLWLLLCGHLIGDFYLQPQVLVERKNRKLFFLLLQGSIYALAVLAMVLPVMGGRVFIAFLLIFASHLLIDFLKGRLSLSKGKFGILKKNMFVVDQTIHVIIVAAAAQLCAAGGQIPLNAYGNALVDVYDGLLVKLSPVELLRYIFVFLLIGKPSNILIREINKKGNIKKPDSTDGLIAGELKQNPSEYQNAGKIIGILERILIVVMVLLKQYAAIGLVFTAKSITRYDKISKEPSFAEYYLVGTLLSVTVALLGGLLLLRG